MLPARWLSSHANSRFLPASSPHLWGRNLQVCEGGLMRILCLGLGNPDMESVGECTLSHCRISDSYFMLSRFLSSAVLANCQTLRGEEGDEEADLDLRISPPAPTTQHQRLFPALSRSVRIWQKKFKAPSHHGRMSPFRCSLPRHQSEARSTSPTTHATTLG